MIEEALLLVFGVILLIVIIVIYRDSVISSKIKAIENAIEAFNRELFKVENRINNKLIESEKQSESRFGQLQSSSDLMDLKDEFELSQMKIARIEERLNEFLAVPNASGFDASRAISLHNMGYTVEDISKELRVSVNEIALALKLNNLEPRRV